MDFGLLRSLAHQHPTAHTWDNLCDAVQRHGELPPHQHSYLTRILDTRWPDAIRRMPSGWIEQILSSAGDWRWRGRPTTRPGPWIALARTLDSTDFDLSSSPGDLERLLSSAHMEDLSQVRWRAAGIAPEDLLVEKPMTSLRALDLVYAGARPGPDFARALARSEALPALRLLRLERFGVGDEGLFALARAPWFSSLRGCYLAHDTISARSLIPMARGAFGALALGELDLRGCPVDERVALALLTSNALPELSALALPEQARTLDVRRHAARARVQLVACDAARGILVEVEGSERDQALFEKEVVHIGRASALNDLALRHASVSTRHCRLLHHGDELYIEDMMSADGIRINGARRARARLSPRDVVRVGECHFRARLAI